MEDYVNQKPVDIVLEYEKINFLSILFTLLVIIATIIVVVKNKDYSDIKKNDNAY